MEGPLRIRFKGRGRAQSTISQRNRDGLRVKGGRRSKTSLRTRYMITIYAFDQIERASHSHHDLKANGLKLEAGNVEPEHTTIPTKTSNRQNDSTEDSCLVLSLRKRKTKTTTTLTSVTMTS